MNGLDRLAWDRFGLIMGTEVLVSVFLQEDERYQFYNVGLLAEWDATSFMVIQSAMLYNHELYRWEHQSYIGTFGRIQDNVTVHSLSFPLGLEFKGVYNGFLKPSIKMGLEPHFQVSMIHWTNQTSDRHKYDLVNRFGLLPFMKLEFRTGTKYGFIYGAQVSKYSREWYSGFEDLRISWTFRVYFF